MDNSLHVLERIAELKKWQKEQHELLIQKQITQRNLLMVEQQRMYEALGLSMSSDSADKNESDKSVSISERNNLPSLCSSYDEIEGVSKLDDNTDSETESIENNNESNTENIENCSNGNHQMEHLSYNECADKNKSNESIRTESETTDSKSPNISPTVSNFKLKTKINFDDVPIKSPKRHAVSHRLEKQLDFHLDEYNTRNNNDNFKPKRPFLRRGQGLVRFKMNIDNCKLTNIPKYKFANTHARRLNSNNTPATESHLLAPDASKKNIANVKSFSNLNTQRSLTKPNTNKVVTDIRSQSVEASETQGKFHLLKDSSLRITPKINKSENIQLNKKLQGSKFEEQSKQQSNITEIQKFPLTKLKLNTNSKKPPTTWAKVLDPDELVTNMQMLNDSTIDKIKKEQQEIDELNIFELLEQKVNNSSFCSTSSLISRLLDTEPLVNTNEKIPLKIAPAPSQLDIKYIEETDTDESHIYNNADSESECENTNDSLHVRFADTVQEFKSDTSCESDLESISTSCTSTPNPKQKVNKTNSVTSNESFDQEDDCRNNSSLSDSTLKSRTIESSRLSTTTDSEIQTTEKFESAFNHTLHLQSTNFIMNESSKQNILHQSELLKSRLQQLENEIEIFRKENANLTRLKQQHEIEKLKFAKHIREAERKIKDEKEQLESYISEEKQKIAKEKIIFEKYVHDLKNNPTKKERHEITSLKEKIAELQLEIKSKDSKSGAAQARLRTQIRNMEKEITTFKSDIDTLKEKNKKLLQLNNRHRKSSSTKMLHEINKNLTKLAPEGIEIQEVHPQRKIPSKILKQNSVSVGRVISHEAPKRRFSSLPDLEQRHSIQSLNRSTESISTDESDKNSEIGTENQPSSNSSSVSNLVEIVNENENPNKSILENENKSSYFPNLEIKKNIAQTTEKSDVTTKEIVGQKGSIESLYQNEFNSSKPNISSNTSTGERREITHDDGRKEVWYPNGNIKKISPDGKIIKMIYFNGDVKETSVDDGVIKYFYAETKTWHTTLTNGLELLEFANGQVERRHKDGSCEIRYPDGSICIKNPLNLNLIEEWRYPDGTVVTHSKNGEKIIALPNGQREVHNQEHKRREYPDGTVKLVYPDGSQETRYSTGRVRLKDSQGNLIMDSGAS